MKNIISKNDLSSKLLIKLIEQTTQHLQIELPSTDDLQAYESEQDERYLMIDEIYNYLINQIELYEEDLHQLEIYQTSDLLYFYCAYHEHIGG